MKKSASLMVFILIFFAGMAIFIGKKINASETRPNVFLISIDTLRADHLGCYGYHKDITSNIDKFGNDAVIFRNCIAQCPSTLPSHASIFTSLIPSHHGASYSSKNSISEKALTLGEIFKACGYKTVSFNGGGQVSGAFGFERGFDMYKRVKGRFKHCVDTCIDWIRENRTSNFLMFLHTFEVHDPYAPLKKHLTNIEKDYAGNLPDDMSRKEHFDKINNGKIKVSDDDIRHIINLYNAEIISMDHAFASLIDFLKENNLYDHSFIIWFFSNLVGESLIDFQRKVA